jgi:hypothetical protein
MPLYSGKTVALRIDLNNAAGFRGGAIRSNVARLTVPAADSFPIRQQLYHHLRDLPLPCEILFRILYTL